MTILSIDHLQKTFGQRQALDGVTFTVRSGEIYGFVGSNGAGKTTTMRAVLGVITIDSGQVLVDGRPITQDDRRKIGYMPEERGLYPKMAVGEQLTYLGQLHGLSKTTAREAAQRWAKRLGVAERLPDLVDSLSLGNQQRVQLAAALVHDPTMLVLDEPFSGLDPVAVSVMSEVLSEIASTGTPVIFSSHQLELVERLSDRIGIIAEGQIIAEGSVEDLRAHAPERYQIRARGLPPGWASALPGIREETTDATGSLVEILPDAATGEAALLRHAVTLADVTEYTRIRPTLTELYREVVSA